MRKMCKGLELCESSYYQCLRGERRRQKRQQEERGLIERITAVFVDLYNKELVGYSVSKSIDTELACKPLENALHRKKKLIR